MSGLDSLGSLLPPILTVRYNFFQPFFVVPGQLFFALNSRFEQIPFAFSLRVAGRDSDTASRVSNRLVANWIFRDKCIDTLRVV